MEEQEWLELQDLTDRLEGGTMLLFVLLDALDRNTLSPEELSLVLSGVFDYLHGLVAGLRTVLDPRRDPKKDGERRVST